jgi:hypothetical protein
MPSLTFHLSWALAAATIFYDSVGTLEVQIGEFQAVAHDDLT